MTAIYLGVFISTLLLSFALTWYVRNTALAHRWVSLPASSRHIHEVPLPRLGGVAIFISFVTVIGLLLAAAKVFGLNIEVSPQTVFSLLAAGTLIFLVGLYDDVRSLKPSLKLALESIAAMLLFFEGYRVFHLFGWQNFGWIALPLTVMWVLWITNAFNLIDGVDGLAAGSALFATLTVFIISLIGGNPLVCLLTLALAGSILGFLRFNFNPATIFLGDCGSLFIGFMLSALALAGSQKTPTVIAVAIPVVSFGLPILETVLSVLRRWLNGQPLLGADRDHIHHKLLARGFSQRQVVIILYGVSALCGLLSLFLLYPGGASIGVVMVVLGAGIWIGVQRLGYHEFLELGRVAQRTMEQKKIIVNNLAIRRATESFSRATEMDAVEQILRDAFETNAFEGFNLTIDPALVHLDEPHNILAWRKAGQPGREAGTSLWTLTLDLESESGQNLGTFSVYRKCDGSPLLVDINLLISGFNAALSRALAAATSPALQRAKERAEMPPSPVPVETNPPSIRISGEAG